MARVDPGVAECYRARQVSTGLRGSPRRIVAASDVVIARRGFASAGTMTTTHGGHVYYVIKVPKDTDGNER